MRALLILPLVLVAGAVAGPVSAQGYYAGPVESPHASRNLGGGFIEMLMTGRDPTPRGGVVYNQPASERGYSAYGYSVPARRYAPDPFEEAMPPRERRRSAALGEPVESSRPIERVIDPRFLKQEVAYDGPQRAGTIIIDTQQKFLFLVQPGGRALRYGIGVGRPGFSWKGAKTVSRKAQWPSWTPPAEMLKRRPDLPRFMAGGPENPMGARALYLGSTLYRIHGTNEPQTIGQAVSSGCFRMTNDDVTDLYERVPVGAKVLVI